MTTTEKKLIKSLDDLVDTWTDINHIWQIENDTMDEVLSNEYPFAKCFNELNHEVQSWRDIVEINIKDKYKRDAWANSKRIVSKEYLVDNMEYDAECIYASHAYMYADGTYIEIKNNGLFYALVDRSEYESRDIREIEKHIWEYVSNENWDEIKNKLNK